MSILDVLSVFDVVAVILGVLFTIRKLDAQKREHKDFPHVDPKAFEDWQQREVGVFSVAVLACFLKFFGGLGFNLFFARTMSFEQARLIAGTIDMSWLVIMLITFVRTRSLTKLRSDLGIVLGGFVAEGEDVGVTRELKEALRTLDDGDLTRAEYELNQILLDADDSVRPIALFWLGQCYLRQGKEDAARDAFRESLELDPRLQQPKEALAALSKSED